MALEAEPPCFCTNRSSTGLSKHETQKNEYKWAVPFLKSEHWILIK